MNKLFCPHRPGTRARHRQFPLTVEPIERRQLLSTFVVTNTNDAGPGSLRQAITDSNNDTSNPGVDTIDFAINGLGVQTIQPLSDLPTITHPVFIDGNFQPGSTVNTDPNKNQRSVTELG